MKENIVMAIIIGLGLSIIAIPMYYAFQKDPQWDNPGIETICTVYKMNGTSARSSVFVEYYVNGKRYSKATNIKPYGLRPGETFVISYNPENPEQFKVQGHKPVFLPGEETIRTIGTIIKVVTFGVKIPCVMFEYTVLDNGKRIKREQILMVNFEELFPDLKPGNVYEMEYWVNDPGRAVIYLDKRVE